MPKPPPAAIIVLIALQTPTHAACPPVNGSSTPDEIRANGERIVCLQIELAVAAASRNHQFKLHMQHNQVQDIQLQQRFDALPKPYVPLPVIN